MTGWIVYDSNQYQKNEWFANKLLKYCKNFCNAKLIIVERLQFGIDEDGYYICYDNEPLQKPDFVLMRSIFPLLSFFLEQLKIRVFNNYQTSKLCNDKRLTYLSVKKSQVPIMDTMFFNRDFFDVKNIQLYNIDYPIILKSASGHGGTEVFLIKNTEYLQHIVSSLDKPDFLIQKIFYPFGKDLRVYVLGGKIIASVLRMSEGIKSNYSLGGKAHYYQLNSLEQKLVNDLLHKLHFCPDFIGIDFLYSNDRLVFNEIEDVVGTRMLYETTEIDAALLYTDYIRKIITMDS